MTWTEKMIEFKQLRCELDVLRERLKQTNNPAERQALIRNAGRLIADLEAAIQQSQKELAELRERLGSL
jgi:regulator of replication initiation timing